jgi:hypothetical protein
MSVFLTTVSEWLSPMIASLKPLADVLAQEGAAFGGLCLFGLAILVVNILLLVWVAKDAQARGTSAGAWVVIVLLFGILGLLVYLVARPKGRLVACSNCGKNKPIADPICPHCGTRVIS